MQFSLITIVAALAASASAQYAVNGTTSAVGTGSVRPTGTISIRTSSVSGTGAPRPTSAIPFTGAAAIPTAFAGSALGLVVAGGVAMIL